ncbi:MFS transporter [Burkholderia sp. TSV86]|uniref:MFS transporter n=1 Tax=Burkholderia sp. TSV86 TaxID=1385594 RepID=UPI0007564832|nr:MFS transporter [Burkholderia sp. TSV86]KVE35492.1 MFS transporter [Burkholderia sp. TSV86]
MVPQAGTIDDPLSTAYRKINLRVLAFLAACYCIAFIDRVNIGFAKLQMQHDIGFSEAAYGLGAGIFFLGYMLFEVPSNMLLVRIGARRTLSRIMVLWAAASIATGFVADIKTFYLLRFLLGVFEAGFAPGMIYFLTRWYPPQRMGRAMALLLCAGPVGSIVGGPLSGWIIANLSGVAGLAGWQWMFILEGMPALLLGVVTFAVLCESPAQARWLTHAEKIAVSEDIERHRPRRDSAGWRYVLPRVLGDLQIYRLAAVYFGLISGLYAVSFWLPTLLKAAGLRGYVEIGLYCAIPYLVTVAAMFAVGRHSDRLGERRTHAALMAAVGALALAVAAHCFDRFAIALAAITIATAAMYASYAVFWTIPTGYLDASHAAVGIAFINTLGLFGGFVSPTLIGWIKSASGSGEAGFLAIAALLLLSAILLVARPLPRIDAVSP